MTRPSESFEVELPPPESGSHPIPRARRGIGGGSVRLHQPIGVDSFATTQLAWDVQARQILVLKRLHGHLIDDAALARAFREDARLALAIDHPCVVRTVAVIDEPGELAIATRYVQGASLAEVLDAIHPRSAPCGVATAVVAAVLRGLSAAHAASVVHRDVSHETVLLCEDGIARVFGFGVARAAALRQTPLPSVRMKLPYASPEELTEQRFDGRSDVYAASVVLWEALTGRPLFDGDSVEATLQNILGAPVRPPSAFAPGVSRDVDAIVLRGLERDAARRYASAAEMADDLEQRGSCAPTGELMEVLGSLRIRAFERRKAVARGIVSRERRG
jgi:serine/threonine-protein kinase